MSSLRMDAWAVVRGGCEKEIETRTQSYIAFACKICNNVDKPSTKQSYRRQHNKALQESTVRFSCRTTSSPLRTILISPCNNNVFWQHFLQDLAGRELVRWPQPLRLTEASLITALRRFTREPWRRKGSKRQVQPMVFSLTQRAFTGINI